MQKLFLLLAVVTVVFSAACKAEAPQTAVPPFLKLMLPEVIYAAPGIESNIYFENIIDSATPRNYAVEVKCPRGSQYSDRWFWTPEPEDSGKSFDMEIRLFNDYGMLLSKRAKIIVAKASADRKRKFTLALLADSITNCGYPAHMLNVMREHGFINYIPVGSHTAFGKIGKKGSVLHDGYGGFSWSEFQNRWLYTADELPPLQNRAEREQMLAFGVKNLPKSEAYRLRSPLLRIVNGKKVLDIPAWLKKINQGKAPDFIVFQLGTNDISSATPETIKTHYEKVRKNAASLLAALRKHAPDAVIGITTGICGCSQDGFGANYRTRLTRYQYRRNIHYYNRKIAEFIKQQKDSKLILIPIHQAIDPVSGYITGMVNINARNKKQVRLDRNALHPAKEGGYQIGDAICCWLWNMLDKFPEK